LPLFDSLADIPLERRWHKQSMPAPIVVAIIRRVTSGPDGQPQPRYLLIRRNAQPYSGRWALVGGKWDFGESLAAAAVREVKEETGLETVYVALRGIVSERLAPAEANGSGAAHFLLLVCELDAQSDEASEQQEGAVAWFSAAQIEILHQEQAIIPSDYVMLGRFGEAAGIPHFEADMLSEPAGAGAATGAPRLARFEEVC
jgi:ADP-ribose pyrophosphatase YjhB (NUDIX family)